MNSKPILNSNDYSLEPEATGVGTAVLLGGTVFFGGLICTCLSPGLNNQHAELKQNSMPAAVQHINELQSGISERVDALVSEEK